MDENRLSPDAAEACSVYLRAIAEPTRLRILKLLCEGSFTVSDIALLLEIEFATVSHHLKVLSNSGIAAPRREGKFVYYSLCPKLVGARRNNHVLDFGCCKLGV